MANPRVRVGISGWRYGNWRGVFYPKGLQQRRELEYASRKLDTIEINGSFYSLQRPTSYARWRDEAPDDFVFAVKGGRFITHMKKLRDVETPLANFFASGVLALGDKLGPVLWQLPQMVAFDAERAEGFFAQLPRDTVAASNLAARHDARLDGRSFTDALANVPIRHALEVRHVSWLTPEALRLCERWEIALVCADTAGKFPFFEGLTADWAYARLHGADVLYYSGYDEPALDAWADRIRGWGVDTYVYFDNDALVHAPYDAMSLAGRFKPGRRRPPELRPLV